MKKTILALLIAALYLPVFAQSDDTTSTGISHYIFNDFLTGVVKEKSGRIERAQLNYNTLTEEMVFIRDTQKLAIVNLQDIDTIYLGGKIFVPVDKVFYEKATNTVAALYVQHKTTLLPPGSNLGYGLKTESGAVSNYSGLIGASQVYKLKLPDEYKQVDHTSYWVNKDKKYIELSSVKKAQAVFKLKAVAIKAFVDANNLKFNNAGDMVKLIEFCNQPG